MRMISPRVSCLLTAFFSVNFVAGFQQPTITAKLPLSVWGHQSVSAQHGRQPLQPSQGRLNSMSPLLNRVLATKSSTRTLRHASYQDDDDTSTTNQLDGSAIIKYILAIATQVGLFYGLFRGLDKLVIAKNIRVPFAANCVFFYFWTLKSRIFNPLINTRPDPSTAEAKIVPDKKRLMPKWTPPGYIFPIMWLLVVGPIRAATSAMIYERTAMYAHPAIMYFILHLSLGDVWNTINNVEKRYGASVTAILLVVISKAIAAKRYFEVDEYAGRLLSSTLVWLTIATGLIINIWRINPDPKTGKPEPLYPVKGESKTLFLYFNRKK